MEEQKEKVQELAETLKSRGLAASMIDAIDKAKNIIFGIAAKKEDSSLHKKEETKVEEQIPIKKEESTEITKTNVDESNVVEKDVSTEIKEVEMDTSSVEIKNDQDQQKLDEVKIEEDFDISKEEKTVNEVLNEKKEDVFISSHESDNLLKEDDSLHKKEETDTHLTEQTPETITTMEEGDYEEGTINVEDIPEKKEDTEQSQPVEEEKEKTQLTEEEKKKADLSEIFNFGKR